MSVISELVKCAKESAFCQICLLLTLLISGLIINFFQFVIFCTVRPFSPTTYRKLNCYLTYSIFAQLLFFVEHWSGSDVYLCGDEAHLRPLLGNEHALLILNHTYECDWLMGWLVCDRVQVLGNAKVYSKSNLKCVPVIGWGFKFAEMIFLERSWDKDRPLIGAQLQNLVDYPSPIWLTIFPEGTRLGVAKLEAGNKVGAEKGLPPLKHHLLPRTKGFVSTIQLLRQCTRKIDAIYDVQVCFNLRESAHPSMRSMLDGRRVVCEMFMRRIPLDSVPVDDRQCAQWLQRLFQEKDELMDHYLRHGHYPEPGTSPLVGKTWQKFALPRRPCSLLNTMFWLAVCLPPCFYGVWWLLCSGSPLLMALGAVLVGVVVWAHRTFIEMELINRQTEYGSDDDRLRRPASGVQHEAPAAQTNDVKKHND